jgi:glyoxylase-like metal-dependent hydrolase (beta-lactamase superfamily II)
MSQQPIVTHFFDAPTNTLSYVVQDPQGSACAIVDSVLNLDYPSGTISYDGADAIIAFVREHALTVEWLLETHVHADHLSAAPYLQQPDSAARSPSAAHITTVQGVFGEIFNADERVFAATASSSTVLREGDTFSIGGLEGRAMHTPGHTPACMTYVIGDAVIRRRHPVHAGFRHRALRLPRR